MNLIKYFFSDTILSMIKRLNYTKLHSIYKEYMTVDFPKDELKPYSMIKNYVKNNGGTCVISEPQPYKE